MSLKIYGIPASRALRSMWIAKEVGVPYENIPVGWTDGGTRTPEYLALNPNGLSLLLGYYENLEIIAGFDIIQKRVFTPGSPSVYIDINTVRQALQDGLAFH